MTDDEMVFLIENMPLAVSADATPGQVDLMMEGHRQASEMAVDLIRNPDAPLVVSGRSNVFDLRALLLEAIEELEDMVGYVPDYFREKWGYNETIARLKREASQ